MWEDSSFPTISGAGPNGAIVHYHSTPETNRLLEPGTLYLVDSGGQYLDGTTDITRTLAIGPPSDEHRDRYTRVLQGHIALATVRFPEGTTGSQLDALARAPLWDIGLDYDHGTGHGVGSFLGVHEGPQRIAKSPNAVALKPGMIVSNEPGYYKSGGYGIRLENLVAVVKDESFKTSTRPFLAFETLTIVPFERTLIATNVLSLKEREWIDTYHARVWKCLQSEVDADTRAWLEQATRPLI
jgi:Xaa-Pro aminopeptidase